jgi:hypothetical protein
MLISAPTINLPKELISIIQDYLKVEEMAAFLALSDDDLQILMPFTQSEITQFREAFQSAEASIAKAISILETERWQLRQCGYLTKQAREQLDLTTRNETNLAERSFYMLQLNILLEHVNKELINTQSRRFLSL